MTPDAFPGIVSRPAVALALLLGAWSIAAPAYAQPELQSPPAQAAAPARRMDDERALLMFRSMHDSAVRSGNVDGILGMYADDAVLMPPGGATVRGKAAMRAWLATGMLPGPGNVSMNIQVYGDRAYYIADPSEYRGTSGTPDPVTDSVRALVFLARQPDGAWKITASMWNAVK